MKMNLGDNMSRKGGSVATELTIKYCEDAFLHYLGIVAFSIRTLDGTKTEHLGDIKSFQTDLRVHFLPSFGGEHM